MSHLSQMKTPDLPCPHVAAALQAYRYVLLPWIFRTPWEPLLPSPAYPKLGFTTSQLGLADQSPCLIIVSRIMTVPYMLSLVDHCHIHHAFPPLRPIDGVRWIHP